MNANIKGVYPLNEIRGVLTSMLETLASHKENPEKFTEDHPWSKTYVTGYSDDFSMMSRIASDTNMTQEDKIKTVEISDEEMSAVLKGDKKAIIRFKIESGTDKFIFTFKQVSPDDEFEFHREEERR